MPEAMMAVDRLDRDNDLDTTLPRKVQRSLGFIQVKAILGLRVAVNEKSQRRYTQLSASVAPDPRKRYCMLHNHLPM